ncbi:serine dehydratase-like [Tubulanus polymorphus]|uniref:serine dehydratase-like n=1 Tax=Tubulanus polymorphus TaxID=672921 RepID=UPI003DA683D2
MWLFAARRSNSEAAPPGQKGMVIKQIANESPADHDGRLKPGYRILEVNNTSVEHLTQCEAVEILRTAKNPVTLVVDTSDITLANDGPASWDSPREVQIIREPGKGIGVSIIGVKDQDVIIKQVIEGSPAGKTGLLNAGDKILQVNGYDLCGVPQYVAVEVLRNATNPVTLLVQKTQDRDPTYLHTEYTDTPANNNWNFTNSCDTLNDDNLPIRETSILDSVLSLDIYGSEISHSDHMESRNQLSDSWHSANNENLHIRTPLIESRPMSDYSGYRVYLKLENTQPAGSFKLRGIGNLCKKAKEAGCSHIVSSSGGNAGIAAAYSAKRLGLPCTVYVPSSTPEFIKYKLRSEGAEVIVHGDVWDEANIKAMEIASLPGYGLIHPFDHPHIWDGHASMIHEVAEQMDHIPDVVIVSVGGGGLMCGVIQGMWNVGWNKVPVIAMETKGANCLNAALEMGEPVNIPGIRSIAKSLGAVKVGKRAFEICHQHPVLSQIVTDTQAVDSCCRFADDHRMLVEPACGATLAAIYHNTIPRLQQENKIGHVRSVVVIVCGGNIMTLGWLEKLRKDFGI